LFSFFLQKYCKKMNVRPKVADGVVEALMAYDYPGNVRELENMVEQAVALSGGGTIGVDDILPTAVTEHARRAAVARSPTWSTAPSAARSKRRCEITTAAESAPPRRSRSAPPRSGAR
jgi:DNA-binding NtrC family response regulator